MQKLARLNAQTPPPTKSSGKRILIAVLVVLLVGAIAALAGAVYVGYRNIRYNIGDVGSVTADAGIRVGLRLTF